MFELGADPKGQGVSVAAAGALEGQASQPGGLACSLGNREGGEAVAQVLQRELAAFGNVPGGADPVGPVGEAPDHLGRGVQVALGVHGEPAAGEVERSLPAQTGECIEEGASFGSGVAHISRCDHGHPALLRQCSRAPCRGFGRAVHVARHIDPEPGFAAAAREDRAGAVEAPDPEPGVAAHQRRETPGVLLHVRPRNARFSLPLPS